MDAPEDQNDGKVPPPAAQNDDEAPPPAAQNNVDDLFFTVLNSFYAAIRENIESEHERLREMGFVLQLLLHEATMGPRTGALLLESSLARVGVPRDNSPSTPENRRAFVNEFSVNQEAVIRTLTNIQDATAACKQTRSARTYDSACKQARWRRIATTLRSYRERWVPCIQ